MKIVYFAWVKQKIGKPEEQVSPPPHVLTVADLVAWLKSQSPGHAEALADDQVLRAAVNQKVVGPDHPVRQGDEVAFFPPFTGG